LVTSTKGSSSRCRAAATRAGSCPPGKQRTISSTASAPKARAASSWTSSITNSLHKSGRAQAARASPRCSKAPSKNALSHSTLTMLAPARS
jgi:hypothetical protein